MEAGLTLLAPDVAASVGIDILVNGRDATVADTLLTYHDGFDEVRLSWCRITTAGSGIVAAAVLEVAVRHHLVISRSLELAVSAVGSTGVVSCSAGFGVIDGKAEAEGNGRESENGQVFRHDVVIRGDSNRIYDGRIYDYVQCDN